MKSVMTFKHSPFFKFLPQCHNKNNAIACISHILLQSHWWAIILMQNCVKFVYGEKRWQCNSQIEIGIPYKAAQIEIFAIPEANEIKLCIFYLHRRPIVFSPHHHSLLPFIVEILFYFSLLCNWNCKNEKLLCQWQYNENNMWAWS